jgi:hypothetical protein
MKKIIFPILLISIFSSCKKQNTEIPIDTISFDGREFNYSPTADRYTQTGNYPYILVIGGRSTDGQYAPSFGISILSNTPITTTGTFSEFAPAGSPVVRMGTWSYAGRANPGIMYEASGLIPSSFPATVTITAISKTSIQGTFTGTLYSVTSASDSIRITNGRFYVRFDRSIFFNIF